MALRIDSAGMDRQYFYAFFKGLTSIKFKEALKDEEEMDLKFLFENLFDPEETSLDEFNKMVEQSLQAIEALVAGNYSKDDLDEFLSSIQTRDDFKKSIAQFWRTEGSKLMKALSLPLESECRGIQDIDWEIHLTMASRHEANINKQAATVAIMPKKGGAKVLFEVDKASAKMVLDKLNTIEGFFGSQTVGE